MKEVIQLGLAVYFLVCIPIQVILFGLAYLLGENVLRYPWQFWTGLEIPLLGVALVLGWGKGKEFCECGHVFRAHSVVRTSYCMMGGCQCLTFRPVDRQPRQRERKS